MVRPDYETKVSRWSQNPAMRLRHGLGAEIYPQPIPRRIGLLIGGGATVTDNLRTFPA